MHRNFGEGGGERSKREWHSPALRELKEMKNTFEDNHEVVHNLFALLIMQRIVDGKGEFYGAKEWLLSPWLSDSMLMTSIESAEDFNKATHVLKTEMRMGMTQQEKERDTAATARRRMLLSTNRIETDANGFYEAPKLQTRSSGVIFTNIWRNGETPNARMIAPESLTYRVNLALTPNISNHRVVMDLYDLLGQNTTLMKHGFKIKTLSNVGVDAVVTYAGEQGLPAALEVIANYCKEERIGFVSGVPFGVKPCTIDGRLLSGITVTSTPSRSMTFNDFQHAALTFAYTACVDEQLRIGGSSYRLETAPTSELEVLLKKTLAADPEIMKKIEKHYRRAYEKFTGMNTAFLRNFAFPKCLSQD
jgi:hypothetical protein